MDKSNELAPYRLLALSAELRLQIYEAYFAINPNFGSIAPFTPEWLLSSLIATRRQINAEAQECYYRQKSYCVSADMLRIMLLQGRMWPVMPPGAFQKLQRLCLILDCREPVEDFVAYLRRRPLTAMKGLKHMRIGVVVKMHAPVRTINHAMIGDLLCVIRKLLPAEVQLQVGLVPRSGEEQLAFYFTRTRSRDYLPEIRDKIVMATAWELAEAVLKRERDCCVQRVKPTRGTLPAGQYDWYIHSM
jgi:hypothetical protein